MICDNICKKYRVKKIKDKSWYELGVRCQVCEIFISNDGTKNGNRLYCKCCNYRVRISPRTKIGKQKFRDNKN